MEKTLLLNKTLVSASGADHFKIPSICKSQQPLLHFPAV